MGNVKLCESQGAANCTTNGSPCLTSMLSTAAAVASDLSVTWGEGGGGREWVEEGFLWLTFTVAYTYTRHILTLVARR